MDESPIQHIADSVSLGWIRIPLKAIAAYVILYFELSTETTIGFFIALLISEMYEYLGENYVKKHPEKNAIVSQIIGQTNIVLTMLLLVFTELISSDVVLILFPIILSVSINTGLLGGVLAGILSAFIYVLAIRPELSDFEPMFKSAMFVLVGFLSGITAESNLLNQKYSKHLQSQMGINDRGKDLKQDFANIASHYLRTPLTSLKGYLEQLQQTSQTPDQKLLVNGITESTRQIELVNNTILKVVDFEADNTQLTLTETVLDELISEIVESFSIIAAKRGISIEYSPQEDTDTTMRIDETKLRTALVNLVDNAIIYSDDNSTVEIELETQKRQTIISITDHGKGIQESDIESLFQPFLKLDVLNMTSEGMGLGLYFTKRIVDLHGGTIEASSTVGKGTTFTITLPEETARTFLEEIG